MRKATEVFDVHRTTLTTRLNGITYRAEICVNNHKLTTYKEKLLYK
jgi:hypothetical protein